MFYVGARCVDYVCSIFLKGNCMETNSMVMGVVRRVVYFALGVAAAAAVIFTFVL